VEIWKQEWFEDGGVWRSNRDGTAGVPIAHSSEATVGAKKDAGLAES
jgi:molybdopterin synthase catalytic subunit